jgi:hypothetical protein
MNAHLAAPVFSFWYKVKIEGRHDGTAKKFKFKASACPKTCRTRTEACSRRMCGGKPFMRRLF